MKTSVSAPHAFFSLRAIAPSLLCPFPQETFLSPLSRRPGRQPPERLAIWSQRTTARGPPF